MVLTDYADLLNVTPNYLNKCVKTAIDKTAQDLLKEMLILEAKTLIKYSQLNVSEIAIKLCDQTPSNFARFFKKQTGLSPKEYAEDC
jgi:AraC family transcriptional regulator, transcriptional activator of pobA